MERYPTTYKMAAKCQSTGNHKEISDAIQHDGEMLMVCGGYYLVRLWHSCMKAKSWNIWGLLRNTDSQIKMSRKLVHHCTQGKVKNYAAFIGWEKAHNRQALWNVLKIYGVEGQLLVGIEVRVKCMCEAGWSFAVGVRVRQECVMSPWLFNIFMKRCMREMKAKCRCKTEGKWSGLVYGSMSVCRWHCVPCREKKGT